MNASHRWCAASFVLAAFAAWSVVAAETTVPTRTPTVTPVTATPVLVRTVDAARIRLSSVQAAIAALDAQIATPAPRALAPAELAQWKEHGAWLSRVRTRFADFLAENGGNFGDSAGLKGADMMQKMAEMNSQFLALQQATQTESRRFQTLSNASKARHDIAMNAIRNIK